MSFNNFNKIILNDLFLKYFGLLILYLTYKKKQIKYLKVTKKN